VQQQALVGQLVDAGGGRAAQRAAAVAAKLAPAEVVGDDENNIGLWHPGSLWSGCPLQCQYRASWIPGQALIHACQE